MAGYRYPPTGACGYPPTNANGNPPTNAYGYPRTNSYGYPPADAPRPLPAVDDSRSTTIKKDDDAYESWPAYEDSRFTTIKKEDDAYESWPAYEDSVYITIKREETDPFKALEEVGKKLRVQANWHPSMGKPSSDNDPNWYPGKGIHSHLTKMPRQNPHDDKPRNPKRREDCRNEPAGSRHACFERKHEHHEHERDLLAKGELAPPPGARPNWAIRREARLAKFAKNTRRRHKKHEKRVRQDAERFTTTHVKEETSEVTGRSRWDN